MTMNDYFTVLILFFSSFLDTFLQKDTAKLEKVQI